LPDESVTRISRESQQEFSRQPIDKGRAIRDEIGERVATLVAELDEVSRLAASLFRGHLLRDLVVRS
jgi:hypothetical protein